MRIRNHLYELRLYIMAKERAILHCDMNCFYASCEMAYHPELRDKPIAVCGDPERRSGIVLTASYPAKRMGVKTGMPLWEAQQHCRDITFVPAHYDLYTRFSGIPEKSSFATPTKSNRLVWTRPGSIVQRVSLSLGQVRR